MFPVNTSETQCILWYEQLFVKEEVRVGKRGALCQLLKTGGWTGSPQGISVISSQFCCEPEIVLKTSLLKWEASQAWWCITVTLELWRQSLHSETLC